MHLITEDLRPLLGTIFEATLAEQIITALGTESALVYAEKEPVELQKQIRKQVASIRSHRSFMGLSPDTLPAD